MRIDMTYNDVIAMGPGGFRSCGCSAYLHRAWCIHACECAFKRKILTEYPQNKDATPTPKRALVGPYKRKKKWPGSETMRPLTAYVMLKREQMSLM